MKITKYTATKDNIEEIIKRFRRFTNNKSMYVGIVSNGSHEAFGSARVSPEKVSIDEANWDGFLANVYIHDSEDKDAETQLEIIHQNDTIMFFEAGGVYIESTIFVSGVRTTILILDNDKIEDAG